MIVLWQGTFPNLRYTIIIVTVGRAIIWVIQIWLHQIWIWRIQIRLTRATWMPMMSGWQLRRLSSTTDRFVSGDWRRRRGKPLHVWGLLRYNVILPFLKVARCSGFNGGSARAGSWSEQECGAGWSQVPHCAGQSAALSRGHSCTVPLHDCRREGERANP